MKMEIILGALGGYARSTYNTTKRVNLKHFLVSFVLNQKNLKSNLFILHCKKRLAIFLSPAGMSLTDSLWSGGSQLFPVRESLDSDIPAGDGNLANLVLQCRKLEKLFWVAA
jgi:hypothetical protein